VERWPEGPGEQGPWSDEDLVPISALEHWDYCPRQCALILKEQVFHENLWTLRGRAVHQGVEEEAGESREGIPVERALPLWSRTLGLVGKADLVEFRPEGPYPVEYKSGPQSGRHADLQLCAQAMCLEEMLGVPVPRGAVYIHSQRRRREVLFTPELRDRVRRTVAEIRGMLHRSGLPPPVADARCRRCSLRPACLPEALTARARQRLWARRLFRPEEGDE